jgi:pilus assembly protein Flp/PilA
VNKLLNFKKALWKDESGATAIEYGLLAALIAVVIIGAVGVLGRTLDSTFDSVNTQIETEQTTSGITPGGTGGTGGTGTGG